MAFSLEKMPDVNFTGTNTRSGSLITFKIKGTEGSLATEEQIQEIMVHLVSESIVELTEAGTLVYDWTDRIRFKDKIVNIDI